MCGIFCQICSFEQTNIGIESKIQRRIDNRGPNSTNTIHIEENGMNIVFYASVLWMQGKKTVSQPVANNKGLLLFNGDIFDEKWDSERSDTEQIMERFNTCTTSEDIVNEIITFKGPFSLMYYMKASHELIFSRDKIGRNSMLFHKSDQTIIISSVLDRSFDCIEIPPTYIYIFNLNNNIIRLCKWDHVKILKHKCIEYCADDWYKSLKLSQSLSDEEFLLEDIIDTDLSEDSIVNYIERVSLGTSNKLTIMENLMSNITIRETVQELINLLNASIELRLMRQPNKCKKCLFSSTYCNHSSVGILFSGGLDCTILAYLADKYVPKEQSIDLLNVAFKKDDKSSYDVPDRLTGKQSLDELRNLCPQRNWIFKEINISKEVLIKYQENTIADLVYPRQTVLDESLGSALWFAARGDDSDVKSQCRVLILGSGADELFGGYTRHRNAFKRNGWSALSKELQLDWNRISFRNLARDNRVICDHGRQPRMPYLDEEFTKYVLNLKPWLKCFPSHHLGIGLGDKLFLRLMAFHLGLKNVATFPKRALQFGSRIANKKVKGSDVSKNFMNTLRL